MPITRRDLLKHSAAGAAGAAGAGFLGLASALPAGANPEGGYGPLVPDPLGRLDLPRDFSYRVIAVSGAANGVAGLTKNTLDGGGDYPDNPDGTGSFFVRGNGNHILVQNHELNALTDGTPVPKNTGAPVYDPSITNAFGGNTNIVLSGDGSVVRRYPSLAGTVRNCAGGVTPWGSWLTCEETEAVYGTFKHGYVFEVDPLGGRTTAQPLRAMGRFAHEAVCVDPSTKIAYLTEDASGPNGLLYRFIPTNGSGTYGSYAAGGSLEAARCVDSSGRPIDDLAQITTVGEELNVEWAAVPDPDFAAIQVRKQFPVAGMTRASFVTRSKKYEGCWWGAGTAWINCSYNHGSGDTTPNLQTPARPSVPHDGQVWRYSPSTGRMKLVAYFPLAPDRDTNPNVFDGPDNIVVSPFGGAFLCEDGDGVNHVIGIGTNGTPFFFALNRLPGDNEFTGACFSGDARFMFVNEQVPGVTYAITGPFAVDEYVPPVVPEVGKALLLPVTAMALVGAGIALRNRRTTPEATTEA